MNILVTGGSGLVGYALQQIKDNFNQYNFIFLSSKDCNLMDYDKSFEIFKKYSPTYVIHLAAYVGGLYKNINNKVNMLEINNKINYNVVKICHELNVKKTICCLSTCIFPDKITYPINETMLHYGPPHDSNYAYAYSKRLMEIHTKTYIDQFNDNFICIIPTNIYGENDNYNLDDAHVIPSLIHKCYLAKKNNSKFIIKGTGKPLRQFIYSNDLANIIMELLLNYNNKDSVIISNSKNDEISIKDIALLIAKEFNYENNISFDSSFEDGQYKKTVDNSKLINFKKDLKFTDINIGIKNSIKWFIDNYDKCRK